MRYERKYRIEGLLFQWVQQAILNHPAGFKLAFPDRKVNNIYFDTPSFGCFQGNIDGVPIRQKYRLRWYGKIAQVIEKPVFEIKSKQAELGDKSQQKFTKTNWEDLPELFSQIPILNHNALRPVLVNAYQRSYYLSADGKFRATIDRQLSFCQFRANQAPVYHEANDDQAIVLEIKYAATEDDKAREIFKYLPFRQTKNSKYATGVSLIYG